LKEGLVTAKANIAVFDADFVPQKNGCYKQFLILRMQVLLYKTTGAFKEIIRY
jgi:hypothetical protein